MRTARLFSYFFALAFGVALTGCDAGDLTGSTVSDQGVEADVLVPPIVGPNPAYASCSYIYELDAIPPSSVTWTISGYGQITATGTLSNGHKYARVFTYPDLNDDDVRGAESAMPAFLLKAITPGYTSQISVDVNTTIACS